MYRKYTIPALAIALTITFVPQPAQAQARSSGLSAILDQARDRVLQIADDLGMNTDSQDEDTDSDQSNDTDFTTSEDNDNFATIGQLNQLEERMYKNVESAVDSVDDSDDNTTYDAGDGMSLSDETFSTNPGSNGVWNKNGSDWYYSGGKIGVGTSTPNRTFQVSGTVTLDGNADGSNDSVFINSDDVGNNAVIIGGGVSDGGYAGASIAIGQGSQVGGKGTTYFNTAIGNGAQIGSSTERAIRAVAVGRASFARNSGAVVVGEGAEGESRTIAVGRKSRALSSDSIVVGQRVKVKGDNSAAFGGSTNNAGFNTTITEDNAFVYGLNVGNTDGGPTAHGFGTTSPDYRLHVATSSDGAVAGFTDSNGTCTINPTNTSLSCSSDQALKKDIENITNNTDILDSVSQLDAVTYRWNEQDNTQDKQYGFTAQDVEDVFPTLVSEGQDGYKKLSYSSLIPINTAAINQLQEQVNEIDANNNADYWQDSGSSNTDTASSSASSTNTNDNRSVTDTFRLAVANALDAVIEQGEVVFSKLTADTMVVHNDIEADRGKFSEEVCVNGHCLGEDAFKELAKEYGESADSKVLESKQDKQEESEDDNDQDESEENEDNDSENSNDNDDSNGSQSDDNSDEDTEKSDSLSEGDDGDDTEDGGSDDGESENNEADNENDSSEDGDGTDESDDENKEESENQDDGDTQDGDGDVAGDSTDGDDDDTDSESDDTQDNQQDDESNDQSDSDKSSDDEEESGESDDPDESDDDSDKNEYENDDSDTEDSQDADDSEDGEGGGDQ